MDSSKLKAFADDKLNDAVMMISLFGGVENTVGKGENAGYQHFLLFPQCFQKVFDRVDKSWDCVMKESTLSSIYTHFDTLRRKASGKH